MWCKKFILFSSQISLLAPYSRCLFLARSPFLIYISYGHVLTELWQRRWTSAATAANSLKSLLFHPRTAAVLEPTSCFCSVCTIDQPFNASRLALWMLFTLMYFNTSLYIGKKCHSFRAPLYLKAIKLLLTYQRIMNRPQMNE